MLGHCGYKQELSEFPFNTATAYRLHMEKLLIHCYRNPVPLDTPVSDNLASDIYLDK